MIARVIGTVGGVGYLRPAPGTWGSAAALPMAWAVHMIAGFPAVAAICVALFAAGWWATVQMTAGQSDHDPSEIVMDEVVGQWIALAPILYVSLSRGLDALVMWTGWIAAFVLFRLFDIWKPWLVGWADRRGDALGVMLDDVIAGLFAAIGVIVLAGVYHGVLAR